MQQRICTQCGGSFQCYPSDKQKVCSRKCFYLSQRTGTVVYCVGCNKELQSTPSYTPKFCSRQCQIDHYAADLEITCAGCHAIFKATESDLKSGRKYCSSECYRNTDARLRKPLEDRFWKHVDKNGPIPKHMPHLGQCWLWTAKTSRGYGNIAYKENDSPTRIAAHRFSWELHYGEIPDGMSVLHHCDVRGCVRDTHLFLGDQQANMTDCANKLRTNIGERNQSAIVSREDVLKMRQLFATGKYTYREIADLFYIKRAHAYKIITGQLWKYLLQPARQMTML